MNIGEILNTYMPSEKVINDLRNILRDHDYRIKLDEQELQLPKDIALEVIARNAHCYTFDTGFGDHFRILVAIGGLQAVKCGIPYAGVGFATLWYSLEGNPITIDITSQMP